MKHTWGFMRLALSKYAYLAAHVLLDQIYLSSYHVSGDQIRLLLDTQLQPSCLMHRTSHKHEVLTCDRVSLLAQWLSLVHKG